MKQSKTKTAAKKAGVKAAMKGRARQCGLRKKRAEKVAKVKVARVAEKAAGKRKWKATR